MGLYNKSLISFFVALRPTLDGSVDAALDIWETSHQGARKPRHQENSPPIHIASRAYHGAPATVTITFSTFRYALPPASL